MSAPEDFFVTCSVLRELSDSISNVNSMPLSYRTINPGYTLEHFPMRGLKNGWMAFRIPCVKEPHNTSALFYYNVFEKKSQWNAPIFLHS